MLDDYVGEYALSPDGRAIATRQGEQLRIDIPGVIIRRAFAEREDEFFLEEGDARLSFRRDTTGRVTSLVLRQGGREQTATRTP